jgi:hypothetical protein
VGYYNDTHEIPMNRRLRQDRNAFLLFLGTVYMALMCALPIVSTTLPKLNALKAASAPSHPTFDQLDRNADGFVNRYEAAAYPELDAVFNDADRRPDGRLDKAEFAKGLALINGGSRP